MKFCEVFVNEVSFLESSQERDDLFLISFQSKKYWNLKLVYLL